MKFRLPYEAHDPTFTNCGDVTSPIYTLVIKDGERSLKQIDTKDNVEFINSFKSSCDIRAMLKRYSLTGDPSVLGSKKGIYGDFTNCETNYAKLLDASRQLALLDLQSAANQQALPENEKSIEGNDGNPSEGNDGGNE